VKKHIDDVRKTARPMPFTEYQRRHIVELRDTNNEHVANFLGELPDLYTVKLVRHCLNTHQMLLDALKELEKYTSKLSGSPRASTMCDRARKAIAAASWVEVEE